MTKTKTSERAKTKSSEASAPKTSVDTKQPAFAPSPQQEQPSFRTFPLDGPRPEAFPCRDDEMPPQHLEAMKTLLGHLRQARLDATSAGLPEIGIAIEGFPYLPPLHHPRNRNYFLDGERGSGKSTILVTLLSRLNGAWAGTSSEQMLSHLLPLRPVSLEHLPPDRSVQLQLLQGFRYLINQLAQSVSPKTVLDQEALFMRSWRRLREAVALGYGASMATRRAALGVPQYVAEADDVEGRLGDITELFQEFVEVLAQHIETSQKDPKREQLQFVFTVDDLDMCPQRVVEVVDTLRVFKSPRVCAVLTGSLEVFEKSLARAYEQWHEPFRAADLASAVVLKLLPQAQVVRLDLSALSRVTRLLDGFELEDHDDWYRVMATFEAVPSTMRALADIRHELHRWTDSGKLSTYHLSRLLLEHVPANGRSVVILDRDGIVRRGRWMLEPAEPSWLTFSKRGEESSARRTPQLLARIKVDPKEPLLVGDKDRAAAAAMLALLSNSEWGKWSLKPSWEAVLGRSVWRIHFDHAPWIVELPVPLVDIGPEAALGVWGRWWYAYFVGQQAKIPVHIQLMWGLASLGTKEKELSTLASLEEVITAGKRHRNEAIARWFRSDAYLLCLPEWGFSAAIANKLYAALGPIDPSFDLAARSLSLRLPPTTSESPDPDAVALLERVRNEHPGYEALALVRPRLPS